MTQLVLDTAPLGFQWPALDPFLFCVHHDDQYPAGNERLGPAASLAGRNIGQDFEGTGGWRMYHGDVVPGFPQHPHRGFETVTIVRRGLIDHSDSLGAAARFGRGDVQWLTAGSGIVHSEMFPLLDANAPNPVELFQIWLNLPRQDKMVSPYFSMLWGNQIPTVSFEDERQRKTRVTLVAGTLASQAAPKPPPNSWASRAEADVAIWCIRMQPGASWTLPPAASEATTRGLYYFAGQGLLIGDHRSKEHQVAVLRANEPATLTAGDAEVELLLLQGRPIGEPVAHYGPFVMNTRAELQQAFDDYRRTQFGGWPWDADGPVHGKTRPRFARHADGREEEQAD